MDKIKTTQDLVSQEKDIAFQALRNHAHEHSNHQLRQKKVKKTENHRKNHLAFGQILLISCMILLGFSWSEFALPLLKKTSLHNAGKDEPKIVRLLVTREKAEIKRGPGLSYETTGHLKSGSIAKAQLVLDNQEWYRLDYGQYMHSSTVARISSAGLSHVFYETFVKRDKLDIFKSPRKNAKIIASIQRGDKIHITIINSKWLKMKNGGYIRVADLRQKNDSLKKFKTTAIGKLTKHKEIMQNYQKQQKLKKSQDRAWQYD